MTGPWDGWPVSLRPVCRDHRCMRTRSRSPLLLVLATVLLSALAPSASAATLPSETAIAAAEKGALTLTNKRRTDRGLIALQWDQRLGELARDRAEYMARTGTFSHTQDGMSPFQMMTERDITWYGGGEIIAWNTASDVDQSKDVAVQGWMDSPPHKSIMLSTGFNYVGFGLAISPTTGRRYWAGVYLKGPDRTGAWTRFESVTKSAVDATQSRVRIDWSGGDTKLQALTAGLRDYEIQARRSGGTWTLYPVTTTSVLTRTWARGVKYEIRVRARDKNGNWGGWKTSTITP